MVKKKPVVTAALLLVDALLNLINYSWLSLFCLLFFLNLPTGSGPYVLKFTILVLWKPVQVILPPSDGKPAYDDPQEMVYPDKSTDAVLQIRVIPAKEKDNHQFSSRTSSERSSKDRNESLLGKRTATDHFKGFISRIAPFLRVL
jgi:hypothetical protein